MTATTRPVYVEQATNDRLDRCAVASAAILRDLADPDAATTRADAAMLLRLEIEDAADELMRLERFAGGAA